jgi:hypothetical protein
MIGYLKQWNTRRRTRAIVQQLDYYAAARVLRVLATSEVPEARQTAIIAGEHAYELAPDDASRQGVGRWLDALRSGARVKVGTYKITALRTRSTDPDIATIAEIESALADVDDEGND